MADSHEKLVRIAQDHFRKGNIRRAIQSYRSAVEAAPDELRTRHKLVELLIREEKHDEADDESVHRGDHEDDQEGIHTHTHIPT